MHTDATAAGTDAMAAQAWLHHPWLMGLQWMVATREGPQVMGDWMFRRDEWPPPEPSTG